MIRVCEVRKIVIEWCREAGHTASVSISRDDVLTLRSRHIGYFIGVRGEMLAKFKSKLEACGIKDVCINELLFVVSKHQVC